MIKEMTRCKFTQWQKKQQKMSFQLEQLSGPTTCYAVMSLLSADTGSRKTPTALNHEIAT